MSQFAYFFLEDDAIARVCNWLGQRVALSFDPDFDAIEDAFVLADAKLGEVDSIDYMVAEIEERGNELFAILVPSVEDESMKERPDLAEYRRKVMMRLGSFTRRDPAYLMLLKNLRSKFQYAYLSFVQLELEDGAEPDPELIQEHMQLKFV